MSFICCFDSIIDDESVIVNVIADYFGDDVCMEILSYLLYSNEAQCYILSYNRSILNNATTFRATFRGEEYFVVRFE